MATNDEIRIKDIIPESTESDLVAGNYLALDGDVGTKKLPANLIAKISVQEKNTRNLVPITYKEINSDDLEQHRSSLGLYGWYYRSLQGQSHVSVALYSGMQLILTNTGVDAFYAIFPASFMDKDFSDGDSYPVGYSRLLLKANEILKKDITEDCVLVMNVVDGGGGANDWKIGVKNGNELKTDLLANPSFSSLSLVENDASLGSTGWYFYGQFEKHVSVKLFGGSKLVLKNTSSTKSAYAIMPKTFADGPFANGASYPTGVSRVAVNAGEEVSIDVSDDCVLVMTSVDPTNTIITWSVNVLYGNYFEIKNELNDLVDGSAKTYASGCLAIYKGSLGPYYWNALNADARHSALRLRQMQRVTITNDGNIDAFYAIFPSSYVDGDKAQEDSYPVGYLGRFRLNQGNSVTFNVDENCVLVMNVVDGGNNANSFSVVVTTPPLYETIADKANLSKPITATTTTADLVVYNCSLGASGWYSPGDNQRHTSVPCKKGEIITLTNNNVDAFYAIFPSSFVDGDQTNSSPFPDGVFRVVLKQDETIKFICGEDCVLVMNTVDGALNTNEFTIVRTFSPLTSIGLVAETTPVRLKIAEWNVGHFAMGTSGDTTIPPEQKDEKQAEYRTLINSIGADVFILCENSVNFCTDGTKANDAVWNCFKQINDGPKNGYNMNSVLTNGLQFVSRKVNAYVNQDGTGGRYFIDCKYSIKGREVHIIATHNTWGDKTTAMAQYNELITYCADFDHVILAADFNAGSQWNYGMKDVVAPLFKAAGFSSAWCDYMGAVDTYPDSEYQPANLDNVFVKGFSVTNSQVIDSSIDLSDHKMITCELIME